MAMTDLEKEIENRMAEGFERAWKHNTVIRMFGLDEETAEALWNVAFHAGYRATIKALDSDAKDRK